MSMAEYAERRRAIEVAAETGIHPCIRNIRQVVTDALVEGLEPLEDLPWGTGRTVASLADFANGAALPDEIEDWIRATTSPHEAYLRILKVLSPDHRGGPPTSLAAVEAMRPPRHTPPGMDRAIADLEGYAYLVDALGLLVWAAEATWRYSARVDEHIGYATRELRDAMATSSDEVGVADPVGYRLLTEASRMNPKRRQT